MRRRTKSYLYGVLTGLITMALALSIIYYFQIYRQYSETVNNYQLLLENYQNPVMRDVVKLTTSLRQYDVVKATDYEIVQLPIKYGEGPFFDADQAVVGLTASTDLAAGTLLYENMLYSAERLPADLRVYQIGNLLTQSLLKIGDSVDIRISFPSGLDYIVLSKKVLIDKRQRAADDATEICIFHLNEDEILRLSSALVDAYLHEGTYLYTTLYISGSSQARAEVTYPANAAVKALIEQDPNIVERATVALEEQKRQQLANSLLRLSGEAARQIPDFNYQEVTTQPNDEVDQPEQGGTADGAVSGAVEADGEQIMANEVD